MLVSTRLVIHAEIETFEDFEKVVGLWLGTTPVRGADEVEKTRLFFAGIAQGIQTRLQANEEKKEQTP